jgi:hypothetical protein
MNREEIIEMETIKSDLSKQICIEVDAKNIDGKTASRLLLAINNIKDEKIKELQHFKDTVIGLYGFDCDPKELIEKFVSSQSDACGLFTEDVDTLIADWVRFCNGENIIKSPFFRIRI